MKRAPILGRREPSRPRASHVAGTSQINTQISAPNPQSSNRGETTARSRWRRVMSNAHLRTRHHAKRWVPTGEDDNPPARACVPASRRPKGI